VNMLVTGAAGFVGSHLSAALLDARNTVTGIDAFTDHYARERKERNLAEVARPGFTFLEQDLLSVDLRELLHGIDVVFHLAGQPGVRPSWGSEFDIYVRNNIVSTQRLLEAAKDARPRKLVYASSSSVYGNAEAYPTQESVRPQPVSPYGVTKLAGEHLCELYRVNHGVRTVSLRLFTVYGPRQRPDMAFSRLIDAAVRGEPFELYGNGEQTRDFTFVDDVLAAMQAAAASEWCGVANVGGGSRTSMNRVIEIAEGLAGPMRISRGAPVKGDAQDTAADISLAAEHLDYRPRTSLEEGLARMFAFERGRSEEPALP
jgi:nucleoside-diphosphate-sugar epimerase